ncbi:hypothetical protein L3Q82_017503, partial [Scortum barcoo]
VCEAGSNGSWCGRVRESCSALGRSLAIALGVASHGTKAARPTKSDNHDALLPGMLWWLQDCISQLLLRPI